MRTARDVLEQPTGIKSMEVANTTNKKVVQLQRDILLMLLLMSLG